MTVEKDVTIMAVDDTPANLDLLDALLGDEPGYRIRLYSSGRPMIEAAEAEPPDMFLLDVDMPEMTGFEVCRRLKEIDALRDIPVIFLTGMTDTEEKVEGFDAGGVDYVAKPFEFAEVMARIRTHLKIRELQQDLENKVRERTQDLAAAYDRLKEEQQRFEWVAREALEGYLILDRDKVLSYANRKAREYLGLPQDPLPIAEGTTLESAAGTFRFEPEGAWISVMEPHTGRGPALSCQA